MVGREPMRVTPHELAAVIERAEPDRSVEFRFERSGSRGRLVCVGARIRP